MGVTRFESVVANQTVGSADIDKLAQSFERLSGSIESSGKKADQVAAHPGFDAFADKIKAGLEDPLKAAGEAAEGALKAMGPLGAGVAAGAAIFTAAAAASFEAAKGLAEYGTQIHNVSLRTGLTTQEVGQFSFAAKAAGQDVGVFESAMRKLSQGLDDTSAEGKKARTGLAEIGVAAYDSQGKIRPMSDIFLQISEGLNRIEDPAKRNTAALQIFGRAGIELIPTILGLAENIDRAKQLGLGPSEADVARWEGYHKQIAEAEVRWSRLARTVKEPLASVFTISFRGATGDVSDIAATAASALKAEIGRLAPEEAQRRLDLLKQSGMLPGATIEDLQGRINQNADKNLFAPQRQWQQTGIRVLGYDAPGGLNVDIASWQREIDAALGGTGDKGALEDARKRLNELQDKLRAQQQLKAPMTQQADAAREIEQQKEVVQSIEARIEAAKNLESAEKSLATFEEQMRAKEMAPGSKTMAAADALIKEHGLNPEQSSRAWTEAYLTASEQVGKLEDEVADKWQKALGKAATDRVKATQEDVRAAGDAAQRSVDIWVKTAEQVRQISTQGQIQRAGVSSQQRMGFLSLAAGPGQEGLLANAEYLERLSLATQIYKLQKAEADTMKDAQQQRLAYARSYTELMQSTAAAEMAHEMRIAELQRQRVEMFRSEMGSLFDGLLGGRAGLQQFAMNEMRTIGRAAFSNTLTALKTGEGLTRNTVFGGTWLADPTKDVASTKLMGAGDHLTVAAGALQDAARSLAMSRSGGGGGLVRGSGIFTGAGGAPTDEEIAAAGITSEDMAALQNVPVWGPDAGSSIGSGDGGFNWGRTAAIGGAVIGGGIGIYSGARSGGARGALTASGSAVAAAGAIISLVSKSLSAAGPVGMIAGAVLGSVIPGMLGDAKQQRDQQETDRLNAARYTAPTPSSYTSDRYGRDLDYDTGGGLRPLVQINIPVQTIDSRDFADRAPQIMELVTASLEAKGSPRLMAAVRNVVRVG